MLTRIAPTPSGYLHTGNLYNFLFNWLWARRNKGRVLLRIDDGDADRKRPEYVEDVFRVLDWLELDWDMGPTGPDDFERHWSQATREPLYRKLLDELRENDLIFACRCSRKAKGNENRAHACGCEESGLPLEETGLAWRMKMSGDTGISFNDRALGEIKMRLADTTGAFVVRKKDGLAAYQVSSLADDRHFGVTHIARGGDLLESTAMQLLMDKQLDNPQFQNTCFHHHGLLLDTGGEKISKSAGKQGGSIRSWQKPESVIQGFGSWMGLSAPLPDRVQQLVEWEAGAQPFTPISRSFSV
jgi:glutamyl/glutaminyl-tRNA synthetase